MYRLAIFLSFSWGEHNLVPESLLCLDVKIHVANLHKVGTASISAQILLVVTIFYKVLNAHFVNSVSRNLCLDWSDQGTANPW